MKHFTNFDSKQISWIKIGGVLNEYIEAESSEEFQNVVSKKRKEETKFEILGLGANTLISDDGIKNLVIKDKSNEIEILQNSVTKSLKKKIEKKESARLVVDKKEGSFRGIDPTDIDYDESDCDTINVRISAGVTLPYVINYLIGKGITGLQMFSGIPGNIGACVFNNIHGGPHLLSEYINSVEFIDENGELQNKKIEELNLGYNKTSFQNTKNVITNVTLKLFLGDKKRALNSSVEWAKRKKSQPKNSLGSVFHNLTPELQTKLGYPTPSMGFVVEHKLKLSGFRVGDAMVYPESNNFIVNLGNATAKDYLAVIRKVREATFELIGVKPKIEIFLKGFNYEEVKDLFESE